MNDRSPNRSAPPVSPERCVRELFDACADPQTPPQPAGPSDDDIAQVLRLVRFLIAGNSPRWSACYLGPAYSYSHLAALRFFGDGHRLQPVSSIAAVFDSVLGGDNRHGVVPIENSTDGRVVDTLGRLRGGEVTIVGEVRLPIHHCLLASSSDTPIREIRSKPQALSQCRGYLARHHPDAALVPVASTSAAADAARIETGVAAVASREAGLAGGLHLLASDIEDNPNNVTRFLILGRDASERTGKDKTSLWFEVKHHPGSLADALVVLKRHELNITLIESFPSPSGEGEYQFFVEVLGHREDETLETALSELEQITEHLTVLGSYPIAPPASDRISIRD